MISIQANVKSLRHKRSQQIDKSFEIIGVLYCQDTFLMLRKETLQQTMGKTLANLLSSYTIFQSIYSVSFCLMPELEKAGVYDLGLRTALGN